MEKLTTTDLHSNYVIDEIDTTNIQHSSQDMNGTDDGSVKDDALSGTNPGYADTENASEEMPTNNNMIDMLDSDTISNAQEDSNDTLDAPTAIVKEDMDPQQQEDGYADDDQQQDDISPDTYDENSDASWNVSSDIKGDDPTWYDNDDSVETQMAATEEETMEQGTVEESDIDDRLETTLDEALEALVENIEQSTPLMVTSSHVDPSSSFTGYHLPSTHNTTSTVTGYETIDDFATIDFSFWLYGAIFILICLRLPYLKRFFTRLNRKDIDSNETLPYHAVQNKELD